MDIFEFFGLMYYNSSDVCEVWFKLGDDVCLLVLYLKELGVDIEGRLALLSRYQETIISISD